MNPADAAARGMAAVRGRHPMVHHITNSVVMNLTANITLCLGASPVMAPCIGEAPEMVRLAGSLLLNIGTLDPALVKSMLAAGAAANAGGIPIVLDPVGAGATRLRTEAALTLLSELEIAVLRGNAGEILALAGAGGKVRGVDSQEGLERRVDVVAAYAAKRGCVIAVTGETDLVTDGTRVVRIFNGHPLMARVTGTGCGATTAIACFAAGMENPLDAAVGALIDYGIAGEMAAEVASGPGSFVPLFLDALAALDPETAGRLARAEELS